MVENEYMKSQSVPKKESLLWICLLFSIGGFIGFLIFGGRFPDEEVWTLPGYTALLAPLFIWLVYKFSNFGSFFFRAILSGLLASATGFGIMNLAYYFLM